MLHLDVSTIEIHGSRRFERPLTPWHDVPYFLEDFIVAALDHAEAIVVNEISLHVYNDQCRRFKPELEGIRPR